MQIIEAKKSSLILLAVCLVQTSCLFSQRIPKDSSVLNYTQVLFEYPSVKNATEYKIQLTDLSDPKEIKEYTSNSKLKIISDFSFGKYYKWRALSIGKNKKTIDSTSYFLFKINGSDLANKELYRMKINYTDKSINTNELVFIDYNRIAINKKGEPVWYLPDIKNKVNFRERIRDLKISKDGTFTFLTNKSAIECDVNGKVLWEAPAIAKTSEDSSGFYHHCFSKLKNGNYMVLGTKSVYKPVPSTFPKSKLKNSPDTLTKNGVSYLRIEYGTIMEYTATNELVWFWNSEKYIDDVDLFAHGNADTLPFFGPHMNSFDYDTETNNISVGFRDLSRIILIDKATGTVIRSYGEKLPSGEARSGDKFFKYQHDSRFLKGGILAVFNNNDILMNKDSVSSIVLFDTGKFPGNDYKPYWIFKCDFDTLSNGRSFKGGSVSELSNGNLLVCMGHLNRIFEVTKDKKIVWDGFYESFSKSTKKWVPYSQYRVSQANSLYPNLFSAELKDEQNTKKSVSFSIKIVNEGSEKDSYKAIVKDVNDKVLAEFQSKTVNSNETELVPFSVNINKKLKEKIIVIEVISNTNKQNIRKIRYEF